jgi:hypothetical protein
LNNPNNVYYASLSPSASKVGLQQQNANMPVQINLNHPNNLNMNDTKNMLPQMTTNIVISNLNGVVENNVHDFKTMGGSVVVGGDKLLESIDGIINPNNNSRSGSLSSSGSSGIPLNTNNLLDEIGSTNNLNASNLSNQIVNNTNSVNSINPDIIITYSAG